MTEHQMQVLMEIRDSGVLEGEYQAAVEASILKHTAVKSAEELVKFKLFHVFTQRDEFYVGAETRALAFKKVKQYEKARGASYVCIESCEEVADMSERTILPKILI